MLVVRLFLLRQDRVTIPAESWFKQRAAGAIQDADPFQALSSYEVNAEKPSP